MFLATVAGTDVLDQMKARRAADFARRDKHPMSILIALATELKPTESVALIARMRDSQAAKWLLLAFDDTSFRYFARTVQSDGITAKERKRLSAKRERYHVNSLVQTICHCRDRETANELLESWQTAITVADALKLLHIPGTGAHSLLEMNTFVASLVESGDIRFIREILDNHPHTITYGQGKELEMNLPEYRAAA